MVDDGTLEQALSARAELLPMVKEYEALDKYCKEAIKATGKQFVFSGGFTAKVTTSTRRDWKPTKEHKELFPEFNKESETKMVTIKGDDNE